MPALIECVPNFSEGRNPDTIRQITSRIEAVDGVTLLHVDPGKATNRTVVTFAGAPEAVIEAAFRAIQMAAELIDMGDRDCLQRSLLLYRELSGLGADPTLMIGFRQSANKVQGHAWVVAHEDVVAEPTGIAGFVPTFSFGRRGELVRAHGETAGS